MDFSLSLSVAGSLAIVPDSDHLDSSVQIVSLTGGASFAVAATQWMWFDSDGRFNFLNAERGACSSRRCLRGGPPVSVNLSRTFSG